MNNKELLILADEQRKNSYCPYSGISVGAALLTKSGKVYLGANIENVAYSPSLCAERSAFASALSSGEREFIAIAVSGGRCGEKPEKRFTPCGVCRQVMAEFCDGDFKIILAEDECLTLSELLPSGFDFGKQQK